MGQGRAPHGLMLPGVLPGVLLVAALGIVAYAFVTGNSFAARALVAGEASSRHRMLFAWAAGTFISYGLAAVLGLATLGRTEAIFTMPGELRTLPDAFGLPNGLGKTGLAILGGELAAGISLGIAVLVIRRRRGKPPIGARYRSVGAARDRSEWFPAATLAVSAGVSEELFFRLLLPFLVTLVSRSAVAGVAVGLVAFVALHRHQGGMGMIGVALAGTALTAIYLVTGLLWTAMLLHIVFDLNALIVRPALSGPA